MKTTLRALAFLALLPGSFSSALPSFTTKNLAIRYGDAATCKTLGVSPAASLFITQAAATLKKDDHGAIKFDKELLLLCYDTTKIVLTKDPAYLWPVTTIKGIVADGLTIIVNQCGDIHGALESGTLEYGNEYILSVEGVNYGQCDQIPGEIEAAGGIAYQWPAAS